MRAEPVATLKEVRADGSVVEVFIWLVPEPVEPCRHRYKYRLHFGKDGDCRLRYDNERGKGDHRQVGSVESVYDFESLEKLLADFQRDVENWSSS